MKSWNRIGSETDLNLVLLNYKKKYQNFELTSYKDWIVWFVELFDYFYTPKNDE